MKHSKRKTPLLPRSASDAEIIRWNKTDDVFDRLDAGASEVVGDHSDLDGILHEAIFQENTAPLDMRLAPAMKAVLKKPARQNTIEVTTLARIWLAKGLEQQLKAG